MSQVELCGIERDVNASPDSEVTFVPQKQAKAKPVELSNSIGRIDSSKIVKSASQNDAESPSYQRAEVTEVFFVPVKVEPILRWQPAVKGTAKDYAGILKPANADAKPVSRTRLSEILESIRERTE